MSQPMPEAPSTPGAAPAGVQVAQAPVAVPYGAVLNQLNAKWSAQVQMLIQENAELQAGVEQMVGELQYLRGVVAAYQEAEKAPDTEPAADPLG